MGLGPIGDYAAAALEALLDALKAEYGKKFDQGVAETNVTPLLEEVEGMTRDMIGDSDGFVPPSGTSGQVLIKSSDDDYDFGWSTIGSAPSGGTSGQVLIKASEDDYDFGWSTIGSAPSGGTSGQVLTKASEDDYDFEWSEPSGGASSLSELSDVVLASLASGDILTYSGAEWANVAPSFLALDGSTAMAGDLDMGSNDVTGIFQAEVEYGLNIKPVSNPDTAPSLSLAGVGAGNVDAGTHYYWVSFYTLEGETEVVAKGSSGAVSITTTIGDGQVDVTIPVSSDPRVVGRRIYRNKAGNNYYTNVLLLADIGDNTTTEYRDNIPDSSLVGVNQYLRENTTVSGISVSDTSIIWATVNNTVLGLSAMAGIWAGTLSGGENVAIGYMAGNAQQTAEKNVLIGFSAGRIADGTGSNIVIGHSAMYRVSSGGNNVVIGRNAMALPVTGNGNVFIGTSSGFGVSSGVSQYNVSIGYGSSYGIAGGSHNIVMGFYAGRYITSGSRNVILGSYVQAPSATGVGQLNVGNLLYGSGMYSGTSYTSTPVTGGKIGIGVVPTTRTLEVAGDAVMSDGVFMAEMSAAPEPSSSEGVIWVTDDSPGHLMFTDQGERSWVVSAVRTAVKSADETVNNSSVLQDDDDLTVVVDANSYYEFVIKIVYASTYSADTKITVVGPTGSQIYFHGSTNTTAVVGGSSYLMSGSGAGVKRLAIIHGVIYTGATAGSADLRWAQNIAEVSDAIVYRGSSMVVTRVG